MGTAREDEQDLHSLSNQVAVLEQRLESALYLAGEIVATLKVNAGHMGYDSASNQFFQASLDTWSAKLKELEQ